MLLHHNIPQLYHISSHATNQAPPYQTSIEVGFSFHDVQRQEQSRFGHAAHALVRTVINSATFVTMRQKAMAISNGIAIVRPLTQYW
jgi:hypothetical protein